MALLLVVLAASDFRFQYRLSLTKINLLKAGSWIGFGVGALILAVDVWFQNGLKIPDIFSSENDLKACLAIIFLAMVFHIISVSIIRPPTFGRSNAKHFFEASYRYIHEGNPERLQVIASELRRSIKSLFEYAAAAVHENQGPKSKDTPEMQYAASILLLIADRRFCKVVVDKVPAFAIVVCQEAQCHLNRSIPIFQFARNIGQEFIRNTDSAFYQEEHGYYSGLIGYNKPVTNIVFGNYNFIEKCTIDGASPLETDLEFSDSNAAQINGFCRASLAFFESYIKETEGYSFRHSYTVARLFHSFEMAVSSTYQLNGQELYYKTPAYSRLHATVEFIKSAIALVDKFGYEPKRLAVPDRLQGYDVYDNLADLICKIIFDASRVTSPEWTSWSIQHNAIWSEIFSLKSDGATKIIGFKVRRLLYKEIADMEKFANFKGARILGFCLHVLGLTLVDRHTGYGKEFYPLQAMVLKWTRANYQKLLTHHPKVAKACLHGSISYEAENRRLVQTYRRETEIGAHQEYLAID